MSVSVTCLANKSIVVIKWLWFHQIKCRQSLACHAFNDYIFQMITLCKCSYFPKFSENRSLGGRENFRRHGKIFLGNKQIQRKYSWIAEETEICMHLLWNNLLISNIIISKNMLGICFIYRKAWILSFILLTQALLIILSASCFINVNEWGIYAGIPIDFYEKN